MAFILFASRASFLFFSHVFPVSAWHVVELLLGIEAFAYADGFEVGLPELLEEVVVVREEVVLEFA